MRIITCLISFTFLLCFTLTSVAQTSETKRELVFNELNLSDTQIEALSKARETLAVEMNTKKEAAGKNSEEIKLLAKEHQQLMLTKMEEILTEEQMELHKANVALLKQQQENRKNKVIENDKK